jgi:hypothetical protein
MRVMKSNIAKVNSRLLSFCLVITTFSCLNATNYFTASAGDYKIASSWVGSITPPSFTGGLTGASPGPDTVFINHAMTFIGNFSLRNNNAVVVINSGASVTITGNLSLSSTGRMLVKSGGTLTTSGNLTLSTASNFGVSAGSITNIGGFFDPNDVNVTFDSGSTVTIADYFGSVFGSPTHNLNGTLTIGTDFDLTGGATKTLNVGGIINVGRDFLASKVDQTISGKINVTRNFTPNSSGSMNILGTGEVNVSGSLNARGISSSSTYTFTVAGKLKVSGDSVAFNKSFINISSTGTWEVATSIISLNGSQTVNNGSVKFTNPAVSVNPGTWGSYSFDCNGDPPTEPGIVSFAFNTSTGGSSCQAFCLGASYTTSTCTDPIILPITLAYFNAQLADNELKFDWSTYAEMDNANFEVEYSYDAYTFESLSKIAGAGNSKTVKNYSLVINPAFEGELPSYYRLKQTDFDGTSSYSDIVTIKASNVGFFTYPNPMNSQLWLLDLAKSSKNTSTEGRIYDQFQSSTTNVSINFDEFNRAMLDVSNLENGTYILHIPSKGYYSKLVKH